MIVLVYKSPFLVIFMAQRGTLQKTPRSEHPGFPMPTTSAAVAAVAGAASGQKGQPRALVVQ